MSYQSFIRRNNFEHCFSCAHPDTGCKPSFCVVEKQKGEEQHESEINEITIIFVSEGEVQLSYDAYPEKRVEAGHVMLVPPTSRFKLTVVRDAHLVFCAFDPLSQICENFSLEMLLSSSTDIGDEKLYPLELKEQIKSYLRVLENYLQEGILCYCMSEHKKRELFFLLQMYYGREELAAFFRPVLNKDVLFKEQVLKNALTAHSVAELSQSMNYSVSGFKKKFERHFGQSVYTWMQERLSAMILKELRENKKTIKEIAFLYRFSSEPRFYEFCKRHYGQPPGEIRSVSS
ncbi:MAG: helix-turn-helix transcriptional regulator [Candidatus Symbiothrix sp.]|jgi:AraC-like DNA-binding protein|nr:helix-turn-helix transcriptional regulator [Candidatus Symbiothrix sp.]